MGKKFYLSKTFWVNVLGIAFLIIQSQTGYVLSPEYQALILGFVNMILRFITGEPVSW